jgi:23S rRNA G2445 N2-methylase RlmL
LRAITTTFFILSLAPVAVYSLHLSADVGADKRSFFATTCRGIEHVLHREISELPDVGNVRTSNGGVTFEGTTRTGLAAILWLRTSLRVMELLTAAPKIETKDDLYRLIHEDVDWTEIISPEQTLKCETINGASVSSSSELNHSHFTSLTVKNAVVDQFRARYNGIRPSVALDNPDLNIMLYLHRGKAKVYRVWSGDSSMHKRGYRSTVHKAALRETTAAALCLMASALSHSSGDYTLLDPMCGSGTIAIEGSLIRCHTAPGLIKYHVGSQLSPSPCLWRDLQDYASIVWNDLLTRALSIDKRAQLNSDREAHKRIFVNDIHPAALSLASRAAASAGVESLIDFTCGDVVDFQPRTDGNGHAIIVTNPPWDRRLDGARESWVGLDLFFRSAAVRSMFCLTGNEELISNISVKPASSIFFQAASVDMRYMQFLK